MLCQCLVYIVHYIHHVLKESDFETTHAKKNGNLSLYSMVLHLPTSDSAFDGTNNKRCGIFQSNEMISAIVSIH